MSKEYKRRKKRSKPSETRMPYQIAPYERKAHDPWGHRRGNKNGVITLQYMVTKIEIESYYGEGTLNKGLWQLDKSRMIEHNHGRFIRTNSRIEKLRR